MEQLFMVAAAITAAYVIIAVLEMKYVDKEWKPMKHIIRDGAKVFLSSMVGLFVYSQFNGFFADMFDVVTNSDSVKLKATQVFTDEPGF